MIVKTLTIILTTLGMALGGNALAQSEQGQAENESPTNQTSQPDDGGQEAAAQAGQDQAEQGQAGQSQAQGQAEQEQAQQQTQASEGETEATGDGASAAAAGAIVKMQESSQILASSIIGMPVQNGTGEQAQQIGEVVDIVLDDNHQIAAVLVGVGGFLGIGEKYVGVPWSAVQVNPETGIAVVEVTRKQLEQAPAYATLAEQQEQQQQQQMQQQMQQQRQQQTQSLGTTTQ